MGKLLGQHIIRKKIKAELINKMPFRWHMSIIMFMTISLGMLSNFFMLNYFHFDEPLLRYPLTASISYVWFFVMIKFYMKFHEHFDSPDAIDVNIPTSSGSTPHWQGGGGSFGGGTDSTSSSGGLDVGVDDGIGLAILIVGIIIAAVFGSSIYVIWQSPEILSEVLIEVFLVAKLGKTIRKKNDPEWMFHVLKTTGFAFAFVVITCLTCGYVLEVKCPGTKRISDISRTCSIK